jgi:hypothetical protein
MTHGQRVTSGRECLHPDLIPTSHVRLKAITNRTSAGDRLQATRGSRLCCPDATTLNDRITVSPLLRTKSSHFPRAATAYPSVSFWMYALAENDAWTCRLLAPRLANRWPHFARRQRSAVLPRHTVVAPSDLMRHSSTAGIVTRRTATRQGAPARPPLARSHAAVLPTCESPVTSLRTRCSE